MDSEGIGWPGAAVLQNIARDVLEGVPFYPPLERTAMIPLMSRRSKPVAQRQEPVHYRRAQYRGLREFVRPPVGMDQQASMKAAHWRGVIEPVATEPAPDFVSCFLHLGGAHVRRMGGRAETARPESVIFPGLFEAEAWESEGEFEWRQFYISRPLFEEAILETTDGQAPEERFERPSVLTGAFLTRMVRAASVQLFSEPPTRLALDVWGVRLAHAWLSDRPGAPVRVGEEFEVPKRAQKSSAVLRAIDYAEAHLDRNISLSEMANAAEVSRFHLVRLFGEFLGQSPARYARIRRIERSQELLRKAEASISEIALRCGFYDQSHFTRTFARIVGQTPQAYRRNR